MWATNAVADGTAANPRARLRDDVQRGDVCWTHIVEVAPIDGADGCDSQPLRHGDYRCVIAAETAIRVLVDQRRHPSDVDIEKVDDAKAP